MNEVEDRILELKNPENLLYSPDHNLYPILENIYKSRTPPSTEENNEEGTHLIVYVHGFLGSSFDLRHFRNQLKYFQFMNNENSKKRLLHFLSKENEANTTTMGIDSMGRILCEEMLEHIKKKELVVNKLRYINYDETQILL